MGIQPDKETINGEVLLTKRDVAKLFQITVRSVDEWQRKRLIPFFKIGRSVRFKLDDLQRHLNTYRVPARGVQSFA